MRTETNAVLAHPIDRVWGVLADPRRYPLVVPGVTWWEPAGEMSGGTGDRYAVRLAFAGTVVEDEVEVVGYLPGQAVHWASVATPQCCGSWQLRAQDQLSTQVSLELSLPHLRGRPLAVVAVRRSMRDALYRLGEQVGEVPATASVQAKGLAGKLAERGQEAAVLVRAGVIRPARPDRAAAQLGALLRWGPTLAGGYLAGAGRDPDAPALVGEGGVWTYQEMDERTSRIAHGLARRGVTPRSKVALLCRNHAFMIEAMVACSKLGADAVLLNTGLSGAQMTSVIAAQQPVLVLADPEFTPLFADAPADLAPLLVWADDATVVELAAEAPRPLSPPADAGRIVVLTSGTTGVPKGARRRNPPGLSAAASVLSRIPLRVGDRILVAAPLFHTWGLAGLQLSMALRAALVLQGRFDPEETLRTIEQHRCTALIAVPVMLQRILELDPDVRRRYDTSSLRVVASSGSALPGPVVTAFMDAFGDVLYNLYGSTEVSWASIATPADLRAAPTTAGRPPLGTRVAILDENGAPVPRGTTGRVFVGNEMLFEGYTNGEGKEVHHGLMATGDRGYVDASGLLFVAGRDDDMIVSGGENVFPREVEELLADLPGVREVAVIGVPDEEFGQRFAAYVVRESDSDLDAEAVRSHVRRHLARYSVPRDVVFLDILPRNATGKVLTRSLRALHEEATTRGPG